MPQRVISRKHKKSPKWRKGESCLSNPQKKTFREQVKQNIPSYRRKTGSGLTATNLARHDEHQIDDDDDVTLLDNDLISETTQSHSKSSAATSISGLTDCSNITFNKVQNLWASPVEEHKQICAVLAAVTEVIRSNNGNETETEYFAALMVAIQSASDEETKTAIVFLLGLVIKRVHSSVLQNKFPEVSKVLFELLAEYYQTGKTSMLKNLTSCLSTLLMNQSLLTWSHASTTQIFQSILTLSIHQKPKVRKAAQLGISSILKMNLINNHNHPSGDIVSKFCIKYLKEKQEDSSSIALHVMNLLKMNLRYLEQESVRKICEEIFRLMKIGNMMLKTNCLQTLNSMFESSPLESNLPAALNGKIIMALYDLQPSINDVQLSPAWLKVMESAYANLGIIESQRCLEAVPKLLSSCMAYALSDSTIVAKFAVDTMLKAMSTIPFSLGREKQFQAIVKKCLLPIINVSSNEPEEDQKIYFREIFRLVEQGLKFKYQTVWNHILVLLASFFEHFGKCYHKCMTKCLVTICDLHESPKFPFMAELEKVVAAAIKSMGPRLFLKAVPLNLARPDGKCEFLRSWLLPLLKDNIQDTELQYFISDVLPLAAELREKGDAYSQNGKVLEAKLYETLQHQIWALLPGFCKNPSDLKQSFKNIARILGKALTDKAEIRQTVLLSLRTLMLRSSDTDVEEVGKYSKNYLPILFNLYTQDVDDNESTPSLSTLETIKLFLNLADKKLVENLFENARKKIEDPACTPSKWLAIMDLIAALVTHTNESSIKNTYDFVLPLISVKEMKKQKKAYRCLEEICLGKSDGCVDFVLANLSHLEKTLSLSVSAAEASSKAPRLRCLTGVVRKLSANHKDFLKTILPEVILSTKANSAKARVAAFNLLEEIGNSYIYFDGCSKEDAVGKYITLIMAGMAGSPNMISATLLSINKLVHIYKDCLLSKIVNNIVVSSVNLLRSKDRDITRAALALVKAIITLLERDELISHTEAMVKNLFAGRRADKNFLRTQTRFILEKLIRKVGYEMIRSFVPEEFRKFVTNVHKIVEKRRQLRKSEAISELAEMFKMVNFLQRQHLDYRFHRCMESEEPNSRSKTASKEDKFKDPLLDDVSSDEDEERLSNFGAKKQKSKKYESWILESSDDVVDLLDSKMSKHISGSRPTKEVDAEMFDESNFSFASNGKLLIEEKDDNTSKGNSSSDNHLSGEGHEVSSRKRKHLSAADNANEDDDQKQKEGLFYQPGGSGIHRSLTDASQQHGKKKFKLGSEYKAKKAGGDMKIKGKPDPFAYIPLNRQNLNKRKRAKLDGQFKGIAKAAKRSAIKSKGRKFATKRK
eukprot:gene14945-16486_t